MCEEAASRGIFDDLYTEDAVTTLQQLRGIDLVVAADLVVYIGPLDSLFRAVAEVLRPGGTFAFSTELDDSTSADASEVRINRVGRYIHREQYVQTLAGVVGLECCLSQGCVGRFEAGEPVSTQIYILQKGTSSVPP